MNPFNRLLNELNEKINLPQPGKSRILLEIAADLNDLYTYYLSKGLPEYEAAEKAKEKFLLSDTIIADLTEIHRDFWGQWLERMIGKTQDIWERILFFLLFVFLALATIFAIITTPFFSSSSVFIYPLFFIFITVVLIWLAKFYQLFIKKDHTIKHLYTGMSLFKYLGIAILFTGLCGYFAELYFSGGKSFIMGPLFIMIITEQEIVQQVIDFLIKSASLMITCMFTIMITGLLWFSITQKINAVEQAEAEILLAE